jgi:hypothetical protein
MIFVNVDADVAEKNTEELRGNASSKLHIVDISEKNTILSFSKSRTMTLNTGVYVKSMKQYGILVSENEVLIEGESVKVKESDVVSIVNLKAKVGDMVY